MSDSSACDGNVPWTHPHRITACPECAALRVRVKELETALRSIHGRAQVWDSIPPPVVETIYAIADAALKGGA
jgi:hypothetical protein